MRPTPFALAYGELARERFPAIAERLAREEISSADRDRFVLLEPVGRLLREIVPGEADADALEAHVRMLHHAYRHWAGGGWVYRIGDATLRRAAARGSITSSLPHPALYLQLPELKVWGGGAPAAGDVPEPLDGMFVSETPTPREIAVLGVFGMRPDRPGFSAVALEGCADADDPAGGELEVAAARADGSAPFSPTLAGGTQAGLHSLANTGELLLLTCRLLALLPVTRESGHEKRETHALVERVVPVE